jgi:tetratricopeptide (TPR) repeat protein
LLRQVEAEARDAWDGFHELFAIAFRCKAHIGQGEYAEGLAVIGDGLNKARDRDNKFFVGRFENTLGWLHQELGDFGVAGEHDRLAADIGRQIKNGNVEISSLINLGFDHLHQGEAAKALALLEDTQRRAEAGFGAHRWRWAMHVAAYLAETLIALGRPGDALPEIARSLASAQATRSAKYVAKCHALRGEIGRAAGQWAEAEADLAEALRIAQRIGYRTLTWQCAHALSRVLAARDEHDGRPSDRAVRAYEMARLAADTIQSVADRLPDPALVRSFLAWGKVQAAQADLDRLRRA